MLFRSENNSRDEFKDVQTGKLDTLYKVRPLLTVIQQNLGRYLIPCTNLALDETCIAIRSMYARQMTFYNPNKPKGKFHLKFYSLCHKRIFGQDPYYYMVFFEDNEIHHVVL